MSDTYDPGTSPGRVRLLIADTQVAHETTRIFRDTEIAAFLTLESGSVMRAAALALESIAVSEVLIQKRIRVLELETDGPAEAAALRATAEAYRDRADAGAGAEVDEGGFAIAELVITPQQHVDRLIGETLRAG